MPVETAILERTASSRPAPIRERRVDLRLLRAMAATALGYYAGAEIGLSLTLRPVPVSTLWLPNAILLGALLVTPRQQWWLLVAAAFPAHLAAELSSGVPVTMVLCWFISNSVEALLGATLIRKYSGTDFRLDTFRNVGAFVLLGAVVSAGLSSFLDAGFVKLNGWGDTSYWQVWETRFRSNVVSTITVVPVILAWASVADRWPLRMRARRLVEAVLLGSCLLAVSVAAFAWFGGEWEVRPALLFAPIPVLLWAALRFGPLGVSTSLSVVVLLAFYSAANGRGPFITHTADENALAMQSLFGGIAVAMMSLAAVVEERRRALEIASFRGEQLQLALEGAQMGMWVYRIYTEVLELSAEARQILGLHDARPAVPLNRLLQVIHPEDRRRVAGAVRQAALGRSPLELEFRLIGRDGRPRWVLGMGKLLLADGTNPARLVGLCADISTRKRAEAVNGGQQRILELIANGHPLKDVLEEAVRMVESEFPGMRASVLLLESDGIHVHHGAAPNLPHAYVQAIDGRAIGPRTGAFGAAMCMRRAVFTIDTLNDVRWRQFRRLMNEHGLRACWASPICSEQGKVLGALVGYFNEPRHPASGDLQLFDVTSRFCAIVLERKRREAEAHDRQHALAHLSRVVMLGELSGALAHEINQPLAAILSEAQAAQRLLKRGTEHVDEIRDILHAIIEADHRAANVIERLRSMLRKEHPQPGPVDLNEVVVSTMELVRRDLFARGILLEARLAPRLPPVEGDRIQLQQVVLNLVFNASDAMSNGQPRERRMVIRTSTAAADSVAELSVTDSGPGIDTMLLDRIFEPFFTRKPRGLGLGLAICRSIVLAHDGKLWAENNPGGGATFYLALPAMVGSEDESEELKGAIVPGVGGD